MALRRVSMTGLMGFVPRHGGRENNEVTVLCFGGPSDDTTLWTHPLMEHVPTLIVQASQLQQDSEVLIDRRFYGQPHPGSGPVSSLELILLAGYEVKIAGAPDASLTLAGSGNVGHCPQGLDDAGDYDWIAPMAVANPGAGKVADACLTSPPGNPYVAARLRLTAGTLGTFRHAAAESTCRWSFKQLPDDVGGTVDRAIAEVLMLDEYSDQPTLELLLEPLHAGLAAQRVVLAGDPINVSIRNVPILDTVSQANRVTTRDVNWGHLAAHFSETPPAQIRVPHADEPCPGPSRANSTTCPPARFLPEES